MSKKYPKFVAGIDAGTSTFESSVIGKTGLARAVEFPEGGAILRSVVYFQNGETPIVGQEAENLLLVDPANGVRHWKRKMGTDDVLYKSTSGREYRAADLLEVYLRYCRDAVETDTGMILRAAVISVPANYNDDQKEATIQAGKTAGLESVSLIHEPTAAMLSRLGNTERDVPDGRRLVVDQGGGTLDISVCEKIGNRYDIKTTNGVRELGGMDYTQALVDHCAQEFQDVCGVDLTSDREAQADLWRRCEEAKLRLNRNEKVTLPIVVGANKHQVAITKDDARRVWSSLTGQMLKCVRKTLDEVKMDLADVVELIPIGGGSQNFYVQEELARFFGKPLSNHADPIHAVSKGAVLFGWEELGEVEVDHATILPSRGYALHDVTAYALGVKALDESNVAHFASILEKGVPLPSCFQKPFRLAEEGATDALIEIFQGDDSQALDQCLKLGEFELTGLPAVYGKPHRIEIEMRIDKNGMLTATAYDPESGKKADLQVAYQKAAA